MEASRQTHLQLISESIDCFSDRRNSLPNRIAVSFFVATLHALFLSVEQALVWITAVLATQFLEVYYGKNHLEPCLTPKMRIISTYRILCFTATLVYSLIIPFIWFGWGKAGPMFSILALSGAIIHAILTQSASRQLLIYTVIPHTIWLSTLPLLEIILVSDNKVLSIGALAAVIALFIHHAFHAAAMHRRTLNQHKENEGRERSLRQRSQELIEEKTTLIRIFSHEIRTPLNGIIGTLELLIQNNSLDDNALTEVGICQQSAFDLKKIADRRLSLFSADSDSSVHDAEDVLSPEELLRNTISAVRARLPNIKIKPQPNKAQTMISLLPSAQDAMAEFFSQFILGASMNDDQIEFILSVDEEPLNCAAFSSFISLHFTTNLDTNVFDNLFWGGADVHDDEPCPPAIAECHKKFDDAHLVISTASLNGHYEINIEIPPNQAGSLRPVADAENVEPRKIINKILVVDDNKTNRHIAKRMLDTLRLPSATCNDGAEAVELAKKESFSAFLMDIQMPIMDGILATQNIRQASLNKTTPIIAISANCQNDMQSKFDAVGINAFLEKPYTRPQLKSMLEKFRIHEQGSSTVDPIQEIEDTPTDTKQQAEINSDDVIVDLKMLSELEETLELDGTVEIITMCLEELGELCSDYDTLESNNDETEKKRIAHKIKGCASSACATALSSIAASIEDADTNTLTQTIFGPALTDAFSKTKSAFHERYDLAS